MDKLFEGIIFTQDQGDGLENITKWPSAAVKKEKVYVCPFCSKKVAPANKAAIIVCMNGNLHLQYSRQGDCLNGNTQALPANRFKVLIN